MDRFAAKRDFIITAATLERLSRREQLEVVRCVVGVATHTNAIVLIDRAVTNVRSFHSKEIRPNGQRPGRHQRQRKREDQHTQPGHGMECSTPPKRQLTFARSFLTAFCLALFFLLSERTAHAQACCAGASGLTPGWLTNHEKALIGAQLRLAHTHGTYPSRGAFFVRTPGRDTRIETSLFGTYRVLPRGQLSVFAPLVTTRRRVGDLVETKSALGDVALITRYDFVRAGEAWYPGISLLVGLQAPTGVPSDKAAPRLAADVTGIGAWETSAGLTVEQLFGHVVLHATTLFGYRFPREVLGVDQHLGVRALYLFAGGWVFDDDVAILGTITHSSDGDATLDGSEAPGTGFRFTQVAGLVIVPLSDTMRLRTSVFTDVPPLGNNRPALGGTSISFSKTWL